MASTSAETSFVVRVPCSSANIGSGFDVIGLALNIYLELHITVDPSLPAQPLNCKVEYEGTGASEVSLDPEVNLITRVALYVLRCAGQRAFPATTRVKIVNNVPLGRGLGSSACAVVGGAVLANEVGKLGLSKNRLLDHILMVERHPDNVAAALYGGFVGTYLNELSPTDLERKEIPLAEVLPEPAGGEDTGLRPPEPPLDIGHCKKFRWSPDIKCIAIIPHFEVATADARRVLPTSYSRSDIVFNMQRIALLPIALGESPPDPDMIYRAMQDKIHQPYRKGLIPGLTEILGSMTPSTHPGLLGVCLSGAGPTILALATHNFDSIAANLLEQFKKENIECDWKLLTPAEEGTTVTYSKHAAAPGATTESLTYAAAGVSIEAGNDLVNQIKPMVKSTKRPGADAEIGGFGGAFDLEAAGYPGGPILIQAIDGIGTKVKIAFEMNRHDTVGIDLVAMNVNDLVVQGAEPLTFLDYYACSKLSVDTAAKFISGVTTGCKLANCALIGGETAEMPGLYSPNEYDAAGCATGALPRNRPPLPLISSMSAGNVLIGLSSSGPHSNGFSLIRKIIERSGLQFSDPAPWDLESKVTVGDALIIPTRIYVKSLLTATHQDLLLGMAHITGGGLLENIPRMLPAHLSARLDASKWPVQAVFKWLKRAGGVTDKEFARAWNTGLGMVCVVQREKLELVQQVLRAEGEEVHVIGELVDKQAAKSLAGEAAAAEAEAGCWVENGAAAWN